MALTITELPQAFRPKHAMGDLLVKFCIITFDAAYVTGGLAYLPSLFGLTRVMFINLNSQTNIVTKTVSWDPTNAKLLVITDGGTPAEAANASDQSAVTVQAAVYGY